jgi:hypothetical protein
MSTGAVVPALAACRLNTGAFRLRVPGFRIIAAGDAEGMGSTEERKRRIVKNELAFQAYNERRQQFEAGEADPIPFVCECGDDQCFQTIEVPPKDWATAHQREDQFVVAPNHVIPDLERVVDRKNVYWTIRKFERPSDTLAANR